MLLEIISNDGWLKVVPSSWIMMIQDNPKEIIRQQENSGKRCGKGQDSSQSSQSMAKIPLEEKLDDEANQGFACLWH